MPASLTPLQCLNRPVGAAEPSQILPSSLQSPNQNQNKTQDALGPGSLVGQCVVTRRLVSEQTVLGVSNECGYLRSP